MVLTKLQAASNLKTAKMNLSNKRTQIKKAKKSSVFRGVTIEDQFNVGTTGVKRFREDSLRRKKLARADLSFFGGELPNLRSEVTKRQSEFDFFP